MELELELEERLKEGEDYNQNFWKEDYKMG
jgi:hypothetical protein